MADVDSEYEDDSFLGRVAHAPAIPLSAIGAVPLLPERFEILEKLGKGSMGTVYAVHDHVRGRRVALKLLSCFGPHALLRFKREFRTLAELHHKNVVELYELFAFDDGAYFTMELIEGSDLRSHFERHIESASGLDVPALLDLIDQLLDGLEFLHANGIIHRDLKPANVLVTERGRLRVVDFGLVKTVTADAFSSGAMGTLAFMAPEQTRAGRLTPAVDLYALGAILFYLLSACGVPPFLTQVIDALLACEPDRRPSIPMIRKMLGLRERPSLLLPRPIFVGREEILSALEQQLDHAAGGAPQLAQIRGESGIGKTSLLEIFAKRAKNRGFTVFSGRCYRREILPFRAFDRIIDQLALHLAARAPEKCRDFARDLAAAAMLFYSLNAASTGCPLADHADPALIRERAIEGLRALVRKLSAEAPLLFVIDDIQWSDRDSWELLGALFREPSAGRTMIVVSHTGAPSSPPAIDPHRDLWLAPLSAEEVGLLAERWFEADPPGEVLEILVRESGGNPFVATELLRRATRREQELLPLDEYLRQRILGLNPAAQNIWELVAAGAGPVSVAVLEAAGAIEQDAFDTALDELLRNHLLRSTNTADGDGYDVYHDRFRAVAPDNCELHRRLGLAYERAAGDHVESLFWHWSRAKDAERTRRYGIAAAERAASRFAFERAESLYRQALALSSIEDAADYDRIAELAELAGDYQRAIDTLKRGLELGVPDARLAERMRVRLAEDLVKLGRIEEGTAELDALLAPRGLRLRSTVRETLFVVITLRAALCLPVFGRRRRRESTEEDQRRLELYRRIVESFLLILPPIAVEFVLRIRLLARALDGEEYELLAKLAEAALLATSGRGVARAERILAEVTPLAERDRTFGGTRIIIEGFRAFGTGISGRWREACTELERSIETAEQAGLSDRWELMANRNLLMIGRTMLADHPRALALAERHKKRKADLFAYSNGALIEILVLLRQGAFEHARAVLEEWQTLMAHGPYTIMRLNFEVAASWVDGAFGSWQRALDRTLEGWSDVCAAGWNFSTAAPALWWLPAFDAAAHLGELSRSVRRRISRRAHWLEKYGPVYFRPLGARALSICDADETIRAARRALELSAELEAPFIRWLCLERACAVSILDDRTSAELKNLVTQYDFNKQHAFGI